MYVGLKYKDDVVSLLSSANNVILIKNFLATQFQFPPKSINVLIDEASDNSTRTKEYKQIHNPLNSTVILTSLSHMTGNAKIGEYLVFM
jgi:archaellum component FlaG (FlaF/FlaG flagellin family)